MATDKKLRRSRTKIPASYKTGESGSINPHWRRFFLDSLAETSNVTAAARAAKVNPARAYKLRREDAEFAREWHSALLEGYEHLEMETLRRLRSGTEPDGPKFDIANALRLLTLHRDTVAKERSKLENSDEATVLASLNARLERIRENELALQATLAEDDIYRVPEADAER